MSLFRPFRLALKIFASVIVLNKTIGNLLPDAGGACLSSNVGLHALVACVLTLVAHASAYLPSTAPPKNGAGKSVLSVYGLHLCALWNGALALPLAFSFNFILQDVLALLPPPYCSPANALPL